MTVNTGDPPQPEETCALPTDAALKTFARPGTLLTTLNRTPRTAS
jgi:hypothetical protein